MIIRSNLTYGREMAYTTISFCNFGDLDLCSTNSIFRLLGIRFCASTYHFNKYGSIEKETLSV
ncbi:hypothetical protein BC833DRAFT_574359, partial [Globomyces pollinis-pini]